MYSNFIYLDIDISYLLKSNHNWKFKTFKIEEKVGQKLLTSFPVLPVAVPHLFFSSFSCSSSDGVSFSCVNCVRTSLARVISLSNCLFWLLALINWIQIFSYSESHRLKKNAALVCSAPKTFVSWLEDPFTFSTVLTAAVSFLFEEWWSP